MDYSKLQSLRLICNITNIPSHHVKNKNYHTIFSLTVCSHSQRFCLSQPDTTLQAPHPLFSLFSLCLFAVLHSLYLTLLQLPVSLILNPVDFGQAERDSFDHALISSVLTESHRTSSPAGKELQTGGSPPPLLLLVLWKKRKRNDEEVLQRLCLWGRQCGMRGINREN